VRRRLGSQVPKLFRCGGATKELIAVRMASEALHDASGSLSLRDPELGHRPLVAENQLRPEIVCRNASASYPHTKAMQDR
jgi:hypothetical protein